MFHVEHTYGVGEVTFHVEHAYGVGGVMFHVEHFQNNEIGFLAGNGPKTLRFT